MCSHFARCLFIRSFILRRPYTRGANASERDTKNRCFQLYFCWINLNFNIAHAKCIIIRWLQTQIVEHMATLWQLNRRERMRALHILYIHQPWIKRLAFFNFQKGRENVPDCTSSFPTTATSATPTPTSTLNATSWLSCVCWSCILRFSLSRTSSLGALFFNSISRSFSRWS